MDARYRGHACHVVLTVRTSSRALYIVKLSHAIMSCDRLEPRSRAQIHGMQTPLQARSTWRHNKSPPSHSFFCCWTICFLSTQLEVFTPPPSSSMQSQ